MGAALQQIRHSIRTRLPSAGARSGSDMQERDRSLQQRKDAHRAHRQSLAQETRPPPSPGTSSSVAYLCATLKAVLPADTTWVCEPVTNRLIVSDQLAAPQPRTFYTSGGSALG